MSEEPNSEKHTRGRCIVTIFMAVGLTVAFGLLLDTLQLVLVALGWPVGLGLCVFSVIGFAFAALSFIVVRRRKLPRLWYLPGMLLMAAAFVWAAVGFERIVLSALHQRADLANKTETFNGSSEDLKHTVVVPTLDTPMPAGKNVIWCSSFQIAWNEMADSVIKGPIQVDGAEEVAGRLNKAEASKDDIEEDDYFAAAD